MCGIFGVTGDRDAATTATEALARMAYRGYDSAGVATASGGAFHRNRASGKISALRAANQNNPLHGLTSIGHTRWATHGPATENNAHPHICGRIALVHNGIIENHEELRLELASEGISPKSDTDSEIVALMINQAVAILPPLEALRQVMSKLKGTYALAFLISDDPDKIYVSRMGSPLVVGHSEDKNYVGSCAISLAPLTQQVSYLEDGDIGAVSATGVYIEQPDGTRAYRPIQKIEASAKESEKGDHKHYMVKEMLEQPDAVARTLSSQIDLQSGAFTGTLAQIDFKHTNRLILVACGTSFYACQVAKYWIEALAGIPVDVDIASEASGRATPVGENDTAVFVSQSGETADTLSALRHLKDKGARILSLVNVTESTIARESDGVLALCAGPEIGVASTKAFTCQLALMILVAMKAGLDKTGCIATQEELLGSLRMLPGAITKTLLLDDGFKRIAVEISPSNSAFFIGRDTSFPIAMEGALKLKEISYIHSEGFAAGELKHGPIALIDPYSPTIALTSSQSPSHHKTLSAIQEIAARSGPVYLISDEIPPASMCVNGYIQLPKVSDTITPFLQAVAVQMISYHAACALDRDVDQPRNLAKAVTV
jgi:glutamine---fructose-6-phosphate transaminase (isomerizing)